MNMNKILKCITVKNKLESPQRSFTQSSKFLKFIQFEFFILDLTNFIPVHFIPVRDNSILYI